MSDEPRPADRTPVLIIDRDGRLVRFQNLTEAEIEALCQRSAQSADPPSVDPEVPCDTVIRDYPRTIATYTYSYDYDFEFASDPPPFRFEHDPTAGVFRLTMADGTVEVWRDKPTRYLCVEPDPETGAMRPVVKRRRPVYLHLCREEREVR